MTKRIWMLGYDTGSSDTYGYPFWNDFYDNSQLCLGLYSMLTVNSGQWIGCDADSTFCLGFHADTIFYEDIRFCLGFHADSTFCLSFNAYSTFCLGSESETI